MNSALPPTDRNELAILEALQGIKSLTAVEIIGGLYAALGLPDTAGTRVRNVAITISQLLPEGQHACIDLANRLRLSDLPRLVLLNACFAVILSDTAWLHYSAMGILNSMSLSGVDIARAPALSHAFAVLSLHGPDSDSAPLVYHIIASGFLPIFPREAIAQGIASARLGYIDAARIIGPAAERLGLSGAGRADLASLDRLASALGLPSPAKGHRLINEDDIAGLERRCVVTPSTICMALPEGDSNHYIFANAGSPIHLPQIDVIAIPHGTLSFDLTKRGRTEFYVFDHTGACVSELSCGLNPFIEEPLSVSGSVGVLSDRFSGPMNLCHFLLDHLPRSYLFERAGFDIDYLLVADRHSQYEEAISLAGLKDKVIFGSGRRFSVSSDTLLLSTNATRSFVHPGHKCSDWTLTWLRRAFRLGLRGEEQLSGKRLYIDRGDAPRKVLNQLEVTQVLEHHGFESIRPETLSLREQIETFAGASAIIGIHGAGLTNILFAPSGTTVVEILPSLGATDAYWYLATGCAHHYIALIADDPELPQPDYKTWKHNSVLNTRDCIVHPEKLDMILRSLP